ncbi:uncharacterized protein PV07_12027 [Cladophialophora immunda]|uniref:Uncharacterized protein n=1 Tax=Cladophialophora immunda TaxID=569365 RepID=A0A0D2CJV8_9EURO|nr:uncharacterized protein PV07_12027 [Cladophialophora immunda]KIW23859.1 hypothetical protein PV07_12027 [Cladophialophora immunda]
MHCDITKMRDKVTIDRTPKIAMRVQQSPATQQSISTQLSELIHSAGSRSTRTPSASLSDPFTLSNVASNVSTASSDIAPSVTSTMATSQNSNQTPANYDGIFVQYERLPDATLKKLQDIYERLCLGWDQNDSSHIVHYLRAGIDAQKLTPALLIECEDQVSKRRLEEYLKKKKWLRRAIRENTCCIFVIRGRFSTSASLDGDLPVNSLVVGESTLLLSSGARTSCGAAVLVPPQGTMQHKFCTFGGLIVVNERIFGLLAQHPFREGTLLTEQQTSLVLNTMNSMGDNGVVKIYTNEPPFCLTWEDFDDSDEDDSDPRYYSTDTSSMTEEESDGHFFSGQSAGDEGYMASKQVAEPSTADCDVLSFKIEIVVKQTQQTDRDPGARSRYDRDWALANLSSIPANDRQRVMLPNIVGNKFVESLFTGHESPHNAVALVATSSGELKANILGCPATVKIGNSSYETILMNLDNPLRRYQSFLDIISC